MIQSPAASCPVCSQGVQEHSGWMIRRSGQWVRFRTRECLDAFERDPESYSVVDGGERRADESPCTEWARY